MKVYKSAAMVVALSCMAMVGVAKADIPFAGSGSSGTLAGPDETWSFNYDGGAAQTGYLNDWGSPGVAAGVVPYDEAQPAFGMSLTFSGGGTIDAASIATGNESACGGDTGGGTTFCNIAADKDIYEAFQTGPSSIEFLSQSASNNLTQGEDYFVNIFFDGATPTSFKGAWLTSFSPTPVAAAPEPSTWLLMFAGIGGIGLMLRRAKKTMGFRFKDAFSA